MLMYIWLSLVAQMFFPGGQQMLALQAQAFETHLRAQLEMPAPTSALFGAASHVARYQAPKLPA
ncbi:MAG: hypothetical protein JSS00_05560 [Proteobacteria bacterium]|nr:hypothetical protein [Pseudomonadota bacterium]